MGRAGRKRKYKGNHPAPFERESVDIGDKIVVLRQPHRLGNTDQRCESPFGRFCMKHGLRDEILQAGEQYEGIVRRWRAAKGIPTEGTGNGGGSGDGPSDATVAEWTAQRFNCDRAMQTASYDGWCDVAGMLLYRAEARDGFRDAAIGALVALARELGTLMSGHPYVFA